MGAFCCCPCSDEGDEYAYPSNSLYSNCICPRFFFHQLLSGYGAMFQRIDGRSMSVTQVSTSLVPTGVSTGSPDELINDNQGTVFRPAPFDGDQRYTRLQRDGLVSRKSSNLFQEESHPLRKNVSSSSVESLSFGKKQIVTDSEDNSKLGYSESLEKALAAKLKFGLAYVQTSSEDEDVCPTCLDEYAPENPKITTRCSHHFHLGCIYEWLERSESCPICGKEMEFCESP